MDKKTQNSDRGDSKKQYPYFDKNKLFGVWIPSSLYEWFEHYLEKYCYRKLPLYRFRVFLFSLQELEEKGITLANPGRQCETKLFEQKPYLQIPEERARFTKRGKIKRAYGSSPKFLRLEKR